MFNTVKVSTASTLSTLSSVNVLFLVLIGIPWMPCVSHAKAIEAPIENMALAIAPSEATAVLRRLFLGGAGGVSTCKRCDKGGGWLFGGVVKKLELRCCQFRHNMSCVGGKKHLRPISNQLRPIASSVFFSGS